MDPLTVLITDDHPLFRKGMRALLESMPDIEVVGEAKSGQEAIDMVSQKQPDMVLMDLQMPNGGGLAATRQISEKYPDVHILVVTLFEDDESVFAALRAGARGYILKDQDRDRVTRYIADMAGGEVALSGNIASRLVDYFNTRGQPVRDGVLAPREEDVLRSIAKGFNVATTAEMLGLTSNTVKSYVKTIYSKLGVSSRAEATAEAIRRGLVDVD